MPKVKNTNTPQTLADLKWPPRWKYFSNVSPENLTLYGPHMRKKKKTSGGTITEQ